MISNAERLKRAFKLLLPADQAAIAAGPERYLNGENANNHGVDKDLLSDLMQPMTNREKQRMIYGQL